MNVSSVKNLNGEVFSAVQDASLTNVVQSNSAQWAEGGGGSVSSKYGSIIVSGSNIEATNKAIKFNSNGFTSSFDGFFVSYENPPVILTWDEHSQETSIFVQVYNDASEDSTLTYSSNTNVTGEFTTGGYGSYNFDVQIPNATAIQFTSDNISTLHHVGVSAPSSYRVSELAWKSDLPTYNYNSTNKISAINGSALVGNEDYLVEQGFVQNLTSPKGTVYVINNNKIEGTNSAIASDVIEGFVSAYNDKNVFPGWSATLTWDRYVPNTKLFVSGAEYVEHTLTYSANTNVTGVITTPIAGQVSFELPTNSTSIVIGNENLDFPHFNFTVSAEDIYEIGELAWASALPTYEYDSTNKISAINGSALGFNETTLYENASGTNGNTKITLSESISNFEYVQIDYSVWDDEKATQILPVQSSQYQLNTDWFDGVSNFYHFCDVLTISGTAYTLIKAAFHNFNSTSLTVDGDAKNFFKTYKVIGINRKA